MQILSLNTYRDIIDHLGKMNSTEDGDQLLEAYIETLKIKFNEQFEDQTEEEITIIAKKNLGYLIGYLGTKEEREKAHTYLSQCPHPIHGKSY